MKNRRQNITKVGFCMVILYMIQRPSSGTAAASSDVHADHVFCRSSPFGLLSLFGQAEFRLFRILLIKSGSGRIPTGRSKIDRFCFYSACHHLRELTRVARNCRESPSSCWGSRFRGSSYFFFLLKRIIIRLRRGSVSQSHRVFALCRKNW